MYSVIYVHYSDVIVPLICHLQLVWVLNRGRVQGVNSLYTADMTFMELQPSSLKRLTHLLPYCKVLSVADFQPHPITTMLPYCSLLSIKNNDLHPSKTLLQLQIQITGFYCLARFWTLHMQNPLHLVRPACMNMYYIGRDTYFIYSVYQILCTSFWNSVWQHSSWL